MGHLLRKSPQNPPAMQPVVIGSRPPSPHENGPADTPLPLPIAPVPSATEHRNPKNTPSKSLSKSCSITIYSSCANGITPSKLPEHTPPIYQRPPKEPPSRSPGILETTFCDVISNRKKRRICQNSVQQYQLRLHTKPRHSSNAASPRHSPNFPPEKGSHAPSYPPSALPMRHHFVKGNITVAPLSHAIPPASTTQGPSFAPVPSFHSKSDPKSTHRQHAQSPLSSARNPKKLFPPPFHALPPPPPNEDCSSLKCTEPLASPPPKSPCYCCLPIRIGLRLSVALYTFFPLVSELANEIAAGVFMDTSQVRIMEQMQAASLPPSPPSAHSSAGIIGSDPYSGDNGRTIQPLGVDLYCAVPLLGFYCSNIETGHADQSLPHQLQLPSLAKSPRKPVDMSLPPGQENLVSWARPFLTTKEGLEFIVDPSLGPDFPVDSITKVAAIASMCVQPEVSHRPFMGEVVQALKLVSNECDETKDLESQSCNQEDLFVE
nr:receptor-like serine/threonine-protein kinase ALE2 isoform X3 [Ipomoea batatas]